MMRCVNCTEPVIYLDAMWMHDNGRLYCPIGAPGVFLATPEPDVSEGADRD